MKTIRQILCIAIILIVGIIIGWKTTVLNGNVSVDNANPNIGYFECWGRVDSYNIQKGN